MSAMQPDGLSLRGKRIFVLEEDDALYCQIKDTLQAAGGAGFSLFAHFPDMPVSIPEIRIDAALVDVDAREVCVADIIAVLQARRIPILLTGFGGKVKSAPPALKSASLLRKPYTQQQVLERLLQLGCPSS